MYLSSNDGFFSKVLSEYLIRSSFQILDGLGGTNEGTDPNIHVKLIL